MAIQFARCEYVSRSSGGNACRKAAYNGRERIVCDRTGEVFSFAHKTDGAHHEVLLPKGASEAFRDSIVLWNAAESAERRKDSQVCKELVLALPDDKGISLEDRIELSRRFVKEHFVDKGVAAQIDIHRPHEGDTNWHAHVLVATRRFSEDGKSLNRYKARDLDPQVRKGLVTEAEIWGEHWRDLQNKFFKEKGLDIKVDAIGILPQEHLGPVRMRSHVNEAVEVSKLIQQTNKELSQDPHEVIGALTRQNAVFSAKDIERFCNKHVSEGLRESVTAEVKSSSLLVPLLEAGQETGFFTTKEVRDEEHKLLRFADKIAGRSGLDASREPTLDEGKTLSSEQRLAYNYAVSSDSNLKIIKGRAGVGKSHTLSPICDSLKDAGYTVVGLAPTHKVAQDLQGVGVNHSTTCLGFLFNHKNGKAPVDSKTALVVDEAAMLSTPVLVELFNVAKNNGCKLIMVGDDRQLPSIERGGMFSVLADKYGSVAIETVRRQKIDWQKSVSEDLSNRRIKEAIATLNDNNRITCAPSTEDSMSKIISTWMSDHERVRGQFILAQKNIDVDALNAGVRDALKANGHLQGDSLDILTLRGHKEFSVGDQVQLTKTDKNQGLINGTFGTLTAINGHTVTVDTGEKQLSFDARSYLGLRHGYAGTVYKAQGATVEKTYVLHDKLTNQNTSYVALTRHSKDIEIFVSTDETRSLNHLTHQLERDGGKLASVSFDIANEQLPTTPFQKTWQTIKDTFHNNKDFYEVPKQNDRPDLTLREKLTALKEESETQRLKALGAFKQEGQQTKDTPDPVNDNNQLPEEPELTDKQQDALDMSYGKFQARCMRFLSNMNLSDTENEKLSWKQELTDLYQAAKVACPEKLATLEDKRPELAQKVEAITADTSQDKTTPQVSPESQALQKDVSEMSYVRFQVRCQRFLQNINMSNSEQEKAAHRQELVDIVQAARETCPDKLERFSEAKPEMAQEIEKIEQLDQQAKEKAQDRGFGIDF